MDPTLPLPDAIQWYEGMLLSPQHMQQDRQYWHGQLGYRMAAASPDGWGVRVLEIDRAALVHGTVLVTRLECVLPDGAIVVHPRPGASEPLELKVGQSQGAQRVYLAVRQHGDAAAVPGNPERRYDLVHPVPVADENTGLDTLSVERLRVYCQLVAGEPGAPPAGGLCTCPLLQVERNGNDQLTLSSYHPPMLRLDAGDFQGEAALRRRVDNLVQLMWHKLEELADPAGETDSADDILSGAGAVQRHGARLVAAALPPLQACAGDVGLHPRALYMALATAAGILAGIGARPLPPRLHPYAHADCVAQFTDLCRFIEAKLNQLQTDYERHRFSQFKEDCFSRRLFADMQGVLIVELKPQPGQSMAEIGHWLASSSIASADMLRTVQTQRQRPRVRRLADDEARQRGLPPDAALFLIQNERVHSEGRDAFAPGEPLMIQGNDRRGMPAQIFLYRHKPRAAQETANA
jgi:type VI secretion system protein ImpJ